MTATDDHDAEATVNNQKRFGLTMKRSARRRRAAFGSGIGVTASIVRIRLLIQRPLGVWFVLNRGTSTYEKRRASI